MSTPADAVDTNDDGSYPGKLLDQLILDNPPNIRYEDRHDLFLKEMEATLARHESGLRDRMRVAIDREEFTRGCKRDGLPAQCDDRSAAVVVTIHASACRPSDPSRCWGLVSPAIECEGDVLRLVRLQVLAAKTRAEWGTGPDAAEICEPSEEAVAIQQAWLFKKTGRRYEVVVTAADLPDSELVTYWLDAMAQEGRKVSAYLSESKAITAIANSNVDDAKWHLEMAESKREQVRNWNKKFMAPLFQKLYPVEPRVSRRTMISGAHGRRSRGCAVRTAGSRRGGAVRSTGPPGDDEPPGEPEPARRRGRLGEHYNGRPPRAPHTMQGQVLVHA
jgi:hypothetical protein